MTATVSPAGAGRLARELGGIGLACLAAPDAATLLRELAAAGRAEVVAPLAERPASCPDLRGLAATALAEGRALLVDSTIPTLGGCPAVRQGAALAADVVAPGVVAVLVGAAAPAWLAEALGARPAAACDVAPALAARAATHRARSDVAQEVACYLECHPAVEAVRYPGLRHDPSFVVASQVLQRGFGPVVDWRERGDAPQGWRRLDVGGRGTGELVRALEAHFAQGVHLV